MKNRSFTVGFGLTRYLTLIYEFFGAALFLFALAPRQAQTQVRPYSDFFELETPGHFSATLLGSGFGSDQYGATHEGVDLEQTLTRYVGIAGRVVGYQIYQGHGFDTPIVRRRTGQQFNFGRAEGGIDLQPFQGTSLRVFGGHDFGDSDAPVVEGDFSSWAGLHSLHPVNFAFTGSHYYNNGLTGGSVDLRTVVLSTAELMLLGGAGGQVWGGGSAVALQGEGGLDLGVFIRSWHLEVDVQGGYGVLHTYGLCGVSRHFDFEE